MNHKPSTNDTVNAYIADLPQDIAGLFLDIRDTILSTQPDLKESIKWKNCLVYTTKRNLIQTVVGKDKISLIFFDGAAIDDPSGYLEGDGAKTRTMRISSPTYDKKALAQYVRQAIVIAGGK